MKEPLKKVLNAWLGGDEPTFKRLCLSAAVVLGPALLAHTTIQLLSRPQHSSRHHEERFNQQLHQIEHAILTKDTELIQTLKPIEASATEFKGCHRHTKDEINSLTDQIKKLATENLQPKPQPHWSQQAKPQLIAAKQNMSLCQNS